MKAGNNICVCIANKDADKCRQSLLRHNFAELRADLCNLSLHETENLITVNPNIIFTFRHTKHTEKQALQQTVAAIKKGVKFIDVDINSSETFFEKIITTLKKTSADNRSKLIISWHSNTTPSIKELEEIVCNCRKAGADIVKIVPTAANLEEASRVLQLYGREKSAAKRSSLIAFAGGEIGSFSRIACIGLGAPFTYCYSDKPIARGQLSIRQMTKELYGSGSLIYKVPNISESLLFSNFTTAANSTKNEAVSIEIPCSKSIAQRALVAAAIANGESILRNFESCADIKSAIEFVRKTGGKVKVLHNKSSMPEETLLRINSCGINKWTKFSSVNIGESALLTRLLIPLSAYAISYGHSPLNKLKISINGSGSILSRDFKATIQALKNAGINVRATKKGQKQGLPITITTAKFNNKISLSGKDSSQFISGLLITLPLLDNDTILSVKDAVSIPFLKLTAKVLEAFGIKVPYRHTNRKIVFSIKGGQTYRAADIVLESDWSSASNFAVAGAIASYLANKKQCKKRLCINNLTKQSLQADKRITEVLKLADVKINHRMNKLLIQASTLKAFCFDATDSPDLFPILTTLAVYCNGESRIAGVHRLINKESNRAIAILQEFGKMGYCIHIEGDTLVIRGHNGISITTTKEKDSRKIICCSSHNDHRMAMAIIICALFRNNVNATNTQIHLDNIACIAKSFPNFINLFRFK